MEKKTYIGFKLHSQCQKNKVVGGMSTIFLSGSGMTQEEFDNCVEKILKLLKK